MNRPFEASSKRARIAFGLVAVLITLVLAGGIDGLADHYQAQTMAQGEVAEHLA